MPARPPTEQPLLLRRWEGVNRAVDPVFLGPSYAKRAQNFIPDLTYLWTNRPGSTLLLNSGTSERIEAMLRTYSAAGERLLWIVHGRSPGVRLSTNDGALSSVTTGTFATNDLRYGIAQLGDFVYVGNGTDAIKQIPNTTAPTAVDLSALGTFTDSSVAPTAAADAASTLLGGLYSYRWVVYNHSTKKWITSGQLGSAGAQATTYRLTTAGPQQLSFTSPAGGDYTLQANEKFHLFLTPPNLPIEFAHDQTPEGVAQATAVIVRDCLIDGAPIPLHGTVRSGDKLVAHRDRIWFAGWASDLNRVFATSLLARGYEQNLYNHGDFFAYNAATPKFPTKVTAIGVAGLTAGDNPTAPLVICTASRTYLFFGDILDDPSASLVEISSETGCLSQHSMVPTPQGLVFCGRRSVYIVPPGGGAPIDVGWPIEPEIRAIPRAMRPFVEATYHKGFYKLYFAGIGGTTNVVGWYLDLRRPASVPSWSGPHDVANVTALAVGIEDAAEDDRGFAAIAGGSFARILLTHQATYVEVGVTGATSQLTSTLQTGPQDAGTPFDEKHLVRVRAMARVAAAAGLSVSVNADEGMAAAFDPMAFPAPSGLVWNVDPWDTSSWSAASVFQEGNSQPSDGVAVQGQSFDVTLTYSGTTKIEIRDLELRVQPVVREVRSTI